MRRKRRQERRSRNIVILYSSKIPPAQWLQFTLSLDNYGVTGLATRHYSRNWRYGNEGHNVYFQETSNLGGVGGGVI